MTAIMWMAGPAVAAPAQPVDPAAAGCHLDGRGAVVGGEAATVLEPGGSRASPMMTAAVTRPAPNRLVPLARTAVPGFFFASRSCVDPAQVPGQGRGELPAGGRGTICPAG